MKILFLLLVSFVSLFSGSFQYRQEKIDYLTNAYILIIDPKEYELVSIRAKKEDGIYRQTVSSMVFEKDAVAGINGGFWRENGDPAGILKIDGKWLGFPTKPRGAIGWNKDNSVFLIDQLLTKEDGGKIRVIPQSQPQYTAELAWDEMETIIGGIPVLVRDGKVIQDFSGEIYTVPTFTTKKHARTAIGVREDGFIVLVVIGSTASKFGGMTMGQLACYMKNLGCKEALNLDGGSSSVMVLENKIKNNLFFEKSVSDAIVVYQRQ